MSILSTDGTPGEIFVANAHRSYFMPFAYFIYVTHLTKISMWNLFMINSYEKIKSRKKLLDKENKKTTAQRRKKKLHLVKPLTSLASAEDPECLKTLLVRVLPLPLPLASFPIIMWSS